jgi:hypothetical protein
VAVLARAQDALRRLPLVPALARLYGRRPFLTAWMGLAAGMVLVVAVFGRDTGLTVGQHAALAAMCLPLAWLCTWIVFLEDGDDAGDAGGAGGADDAG